MSYPMATLEQAHDSRNRAWVDKARGRIDQVELYRVLGVLRAKWGAALYERGGR